MIRRCFRSPITTTLASVAALVLFAACYLGADEVVQRKPTLEEATRDSGEAKEAQPEVEQLLQIRKSMGSAWRGDAFEVPGESVPESLPSEEEVIRTALVAQARASQFMPIPSVSVVESAPDRRAVLREAAHQLDGTAHSLESQELYEQADELRAVAQRFRIKARESGMPDLHRPEKGWKPIPSNAAN